MRDVMTPGITTLHDLLEYDARKFMNAEVQLEQVLSDWSNKTCSDKLKVVLQKYRDMVTQHIAILDHFFNEENINSLSTTNQIMYACIKEVEEKLNFCTDNEVKDACILAGIQNITHFKIGSYGTAAAFAKTLGMEKAAETFHEAEINEKQIDDRLSQLAKFEINKKALSPITLTE